MTTFWIVASILCVAGAITAGQWAYTGDAWADFVGWPATVLLALGALLSVVGIFTASSSAKCPSCGETMVSFDPERPFAMCDACSAYARIETGALHAIAPDYVHATPVFTAKLGSEVKWSGCVVCSAPPTRTDTLEIKESQLAKNAAVSAAGIALFAVAGAGFVQTGGGKVWRVPIPYCDQHRDGAALDTELGTPVIRFASYRAYRAHLAANAPTKPAAPAI